MKKILLPLFLIATSMGITRLSAYCVYNYFNEKIYIDIYSKKTNHAYNKKSCSQTKAR